MNDIQGINGSGGLHIIKPQMAPHNAQPPLTPSLHVDSDRVEISDVARFLNKVAALPEIRSEKVDQIRQALAENRYDVEGRLSESLDRLVDEYT